MSKQSHRDEPVSTPTPAAPAEAMKPLVPLEPIETMERLEPIAPMEPLEPLAPIELTESADIPADFSAAAPNDEPVTAPSDEPAGNLPAEAAPSEEPAAAVPAKRRRKLRYGAGLGFLVLLFAVIGVIATVSGTVRWIQKKSSDEPLRQELALFLNPVMQQCPPAFDDAGTAADQSTLIKAALYHIAETERIRQLREKDSTCTYELEETQWRMIVPQETVDEVFATLFGDKAIRTHKTVGDLEYDEKNTCYYVPLTVSSAAYTPVIDTVRKHGSTYTVRVSYVANADLAVDDFGNTLTPTADMGKYAQLFTVRRNTDRTLTLLSVQEAQS